MPPERPGSGQPISHREAEDRHHYQHDQGGGRVVLVGNDGLGVRVLQVLTTPLERVAMGLALQAFQHFSFLFLLLADSVGIRPPVGFLRGRRGRAHLQAWNVFSNALSVMAGRVSLKGSMG